MPVTEQMCECPATFEMHPWRPRYRCPTTAPVTHSRTAQRTCSMATCSRVDVQPGTLWSEGEHIPVWYCPRHVKQMAERFVPTPPDAESLRAAQDRRHCYCTGRGVDSASGHLHRPQHGCPDTPTLPFLGSDPSDDALLADLLTRALRLRLLAVDTRANAIGDLHVRPNVSGATIDLTGAEIDAIRRRFKR